MKEYIVVDYYGVISKCYDTKTLKLLTLEEARAESDLADQKGIPDIWYIKASELEQKREEWTKYEELSWEEKKAYNKIHNE